MFDCITFLINTIIYLTGYYLKQEETSNCAHTRKYCKKTRKHRYQSIHSNSSSCTGIKPVKNQFQIMHHNLNPKACKISLVQKLEDSDHQCCWNYCYLLLDRSREEYELWQEVIMFDDAQFHLNGAVNRQNCRILATESLYFSRKKHYIHLKLMYGVEYGLNV